MLNMLCNMIFFHILDTGTNPIPWGTANITHAHPHGYIVQKSEKGLAFCRPFLFCPRK